MGILDSLRVVEFADGIAGPRAGLRLAGFGASVIKLETAEGDWMRGAYPALPGHDQSAAFFDLNRGKRSISLGSSPELAGDVVRRLINGADVLIMDRSIAELQKLGLLGPVLEAVKANKKLIAVNLSAWGPRGPMADQPGSELTAQAMAGYTRYLGELHTPSRRLGADVGSVATGIFAVQAILALVLWRQREGHGQSVSLSLLNSLLSMKSIHLAAQSDPDAYKGPRVGGPYDPIEQGWKTGDRPIFFSFGGSIGATGRAGWEQFVEEIDMSHLLSDERFDKRGKNSTGHGSDAVRLRPEYEKGFAKYTSGDLVERMHKYRANAAVYSTTDEALEHPQTKALGLIEQTSLADETIEVRAFPSKFSDMLPTVTGSAPDLGQDTRAILDEAGLSSEEIGLLISRGGVFQA